jgi:hypothetical protein
MARTRHKRPPKRRNVQAASLALPQHRQRIKPSSKNYRRKLDQFMREWLED